MSTAAELTDEEKRVAITEYFGKCVFRFCGDLDSDGHDPIVRQLEGRFSGLDTIVRCAKCDGYRFGIQTVWSRDEEEKYDSFDPLNDLNAMHEAEKVLSFSQRTSYYEELRELHRLSPTVRISDIELVRATARQRAEAFFRVVRPELVAGILTRI